VTDPDALRRRLVDGLVGAGELAAEWEPAFLGVPRHLFIPETVWQPGGDRLVPLRREEDPRGWLRAAYANDALATQVDDGAPAPDGSGRAATSSASQPSVVALMLSALGVEPGMRVCEIGTGTGWNAGLLAYRLGAENVTSIEVDPALAERAEKALRRAGFSGVHVVCGDGVLGYPPNAPYDGVIATAAVYEVPYTWVAQARPGGRIVVPWRTEYYNGGLLVLTVLGDGTARGHITGSVAFMVVREQRRARAVPDPTGGADRETRTDLLPHELVRDPDASLAIALHVPDCQPVLSPTDNTLYFVDPDTASWASLRAGVVREHGPRPLWTEITAAYAHRRPARDWEFTLTPQGLRVR
jgi:protein-L-isoaspartate(D-aspartate) O-methyltransferase